MLEQLRRNSRSFIIWILFGIIILAFVFTFGSQGGLSFSPGGAGGSYVMVVDDEEVSISSWYYGKNTLQGRSSASRAQMVLDQLLLREILAQAAEDAGYRVDEDLANEHIKNGKFWIMGNPQSGQELYLEKAFEGGDPNKPVWLLDFKRLEVLVQGWGLPSVGEFIAQQKRELLAEMMRATLLESTVASADEARARFEHENTTATIDAVVFRPFQYRRGLTLTRDQIETYLAEHGDEVKKKYEDEERLYKDVNPQVRVRQIVFNREQPASSEAAAPEEAGAEDGAAAEEAGAEAGAAAAEGSSDPAREAADKARERIAAGADFAEVAAEVSDDERSRAKGGDLGWKSVKNPGLGSKELADALGELEVGQVSEVIDTPRGYYILKVEDKREGDLSYEQVKHEIAENLALEHYARELARRDAQAALARAQAGEKLDEQFERQQAPRMNPGQITPEQMQQLQQLPPEQRQQILEMLLQQQQSGGERGSLIYESPDIPAESMWQGAQPTPAGDQPAPPAPAPAQNAGQAAGAATEASADQAAGAATEAGAGQAGGGALPARPESVPEPKVQRVGPFRRDVEGNIGSLGKSEELMSLIFDELSAGDLVPEVHEVGDDFAVVHVVERKDPDPAEFDEDEKSRLMRAIARERGYGVYSEWVNERCRALANAGKVGVNQALLAELMGNDPEQPFRYRPCSTIR